MAMALRVLLPEDDESDALLLQRELSRQGFTPLCRRVETREEMEATLREEEWDVVLANLLVNARDAIGGAGRFTVETGPSGLATKHGILEDPVEFLSKPFSSKDLGSAVRRALEGERGVQAHG